MTRSLVKNFSRWLNSAFFSKIFPEKPSSYNRKVRTPPAYYRTKSRLQTKAKSKK